MKTTFFILAVLALCSAQQANPAIRVVSNVTHLNNWLAEHLSVLSYVDLPVPDTEWKFLGLGLFKAERMRIQNVSAEGIRVDAVGDNRLRFSVDKATFTVPFHTRVGLVSSTGEVHLTDNSVETVVHIDGDADGKPIVVVESLKIRLGSFKVQIYVGKSLWTFINTAIPLIKSWVEDEIPSIALPMANNIIQTQLALYGTVIPVDPAKRLAVDVSFFSRPVFSDSLLQIEIRGLPHVNGQAVNCPSPYGPSQTGSNDISVFIDQGFMNCMTLAAADSDVLNEFLSNMTIPAPMPEPISLAVKLYPADTVIKMSQGVMKGAVHAQASIFRSAKPEGDAFLTVGVTGSTTVKLSFEGTNFTAVTVRGTVGDIDNSLSIMSFNGDQRGLSADIKTLAKQLALLDTFVNTDFVQSIPIPYPAELSMVPLAADELFDVLSLQFVDGGFYVGINYRV